MARIATTLLVALIVMGVVMASARELDAVREEPAAHAGAGAGAEADADMGVLLEDGVMPEGLCGYKSKTFSGQCVKRRSCAYQCQVVEHAAAGACHFHHVQRHCYCYRYC